MATHIVIYGLHNRGDNMTLREAITEKRKELWRDSDLTEMGEAQELIIDRIDGMDERMINLEIKLFNLSVSANQPPVEIPNIPEEVLRDAIEIFKATVAEKKLELAHKVVPMKRSEE
jgi:hypothetical protein